jgi:hypothetical protein
MCGKGPTAFVLKSSPGCSITNAPSACRGGHPGAGDNRDGGRALGRGWVADECCKGRGCRSPRTGLRLRSPTGTLYSRSRWPGKACCEPGPTPDAACYPRCWGCYCVRTWYGPAVSHRACAEAPTAPRRHRQAPSSRAEPGLGQVATHACRPVLGRRETPAASRHPAAGLRHPMRCS